MTKSRLPFLFLCICQIVGGQNSKTLTFDAASVRYVGQYDGDRIPIQRGGPGTNDPGRIDYENLSLLTLIARAFGLDFDLISGPSWLDSEQYTVLATVPPNATKEDLKTMLQALLADRFRLKVHRSTRDMPAYELIVAKNGPKLRESAGSVEEAKPSGGRAGTDSAGFPILPPGVRQMAFQPTVEGERVTRETFRDFTMQDLANNLAWPLGSPSWQHVISGARVADKTGLTGRYDFRLEYAGTYYPGGAFPDIKADGHASIAVPLLPEALQQQLGLSLRQAKAPMATLIVDSIDRVPSEN